MLRKVTSITLRLFIGLILLATALGKGLDVPGFAQVIDTYKVLPKPLLMPAAVMMPAVELVLGLWLLSGRSLAWAALGSAGLHGVFVGWVSVALLRGLQIPNCGCFGVFFARPLTAATIVEDGVMIAASLVLFAVARADQVSSSSGSSSASPALDSNPDSLTASSILESSALKPTGSPRPTR